MRCVTQIKCEVYWPEDSDNLFYGDIAVCNLSERSLPDYTIRVFEVSTVRGSLVCQVVPSQRY